MFSSTLRFFFVGGGQSLYCQTGWEGLQPDLPLWIHNCVVGHVWRIGSVDAFDTKSQGLDSRSSHHVGTLSKSFTHSCLWHFSVKFRHSIHPVSGAPLSSSGLEETLQK